MKGSLHTDELMKEAAASATGLRTERRISHVFVMDVPGHPETLFITDAAINIFPTLDDKRDIVQNAIDLWAGIGLGTPKVAILSAVETVTTKIPSTIEAAALCKMAERGQITGGLLDGPLAFDNAIAPEATRIKGIEGPVAGHGQILVVPDLEAGNMLANNLTFLAHADAAGIVLGAGANHPDLPRRLGPHPAGVLCGGGSLCQRPPPDGRYSRRLMDAILVVNAGSSSLKFQVFTLTCGRLECWIRGQIDGIGVRPRLKVADGAGASLVDRSYEPTDVPDLPAAVAETRTWLRSLDGLDLRAIGHRFVHGGPEFDGPVLIDADVLDRLAIYQSLAPLHQPNNLAPIRMAMEISPDVPQVACFDTAFHRGHAEHTDCYALPRALYDEGIRRYGFHGLSYEYIAQVLPEVVPEAAAGRVIVAHLGSGASMCALLGGRSVESTMGFTALDGLPMGTRPGQLDPGVVLHLIEEKGMTASEVTRLLYSASGLKGLSGVSNDMRDLLASVDPGAAFAIDHFVHRCALHAGQLSAALGGLDAFVFTAGVGENSAPIRARIDERLSWLGATLDTNANDAGALRISTPESRAALLVVPTDEELMIARHTRALTGGPS
jgi:acetate kinase